MRNDREDSMAEYNNLEQSAKVLSSYQPGKQNFQQTHIKSFLWNVSVTMVTQIENNSWMSNQWDVSLLV